MKGVREELLAMAAEDLRVREELAADGSLLAWLRAVGWRE